MGARDDAQAAGLLRDRFGVHRDLGVRDTRRRAGGGVPRCRPYMVVALGDLKDEVGAEQVHAYVVDAVVGRQGRQERLALEERLHSLPGLACEPVASADLIEYLVRLPLDDRHFFGGEKLPEHQKPERPEMRYLSCR